MKKNLTILAAAATALFTSCGSNSPDLYKDSSQPTEARVESLLSQMTLEEKLGQLNLLVLGRNNNINNIESGEKNAFSPLTGGYIYFSESAEMANEVQKRTIEESRLGIPLILGMDVIHGYKTIFPIPLAQACTWSPEMVTEASKVAAKESRLSGLRWTYSPMVDVARDARWGRVSEGYGEDPHTNAVFGVATVKGYQGENLNDEYSIAACLKHYAGYAYSQGGRDYRATEISPVALWETVLPPFHACVEAGAATIMSSFNDVNGIPATANEYLIQDVLKERWGFDGFVVSDWSSVRQLINQRYAVDTLDAGVKSIIGGTDMDMYDGIYLKYFEEALADNKLTMNYIDEAVRRVLRIKFELGLFENPYAEVVEDSLRYLLPESLELAEEVAANSMVLLKNEANTLPLTGKKNILLVGAMANNAENLLGNWHCNGAEEDVVTILEGLKSEFGNSSKINYLEGADFESNNSGVISRLRSAANSSDVIVLALGEMNHWSGENGTRSTLSLPSAQEALVEAAHKTGKPVVLLLTSGRPLELCRIEPMADAILQVWQPGTMGGSAVSSILSGRRNPSGKLSITFPYSTGQIPIYYNQRANARNGNQGDYQDIPVTPMYTFGYGLSYSTFEYSDITLSKNEASKTEKITATITVKNNSTTDGVETIFWMIDDPVATITQPSLKMKHFEKAAIKAGESKEFTFEIDPSRDLSFVDGTGETHLESGEFRIVVGDKIAKLSLK